MFYVYLLLVTVTISNVEIQLSDKVFLNLEPVIIALMWSIVFFRVSQGAQLRVDGKLLNALGVFCGLAFASNILNVITNNMGYRAAIVSTAYLLQFIIYISVLFLVPFYVGSRKDVTNCLGVLLLCYVFVLVQNIYILVSGKLLSDVGLWDTVRYQGVMTKRLSGFWNFRSNAMGGYVVTNVIFCIYILSSSTSRMARIVSAILIVLSLIVIPYTFSRSTFLMLSTGFITFFILFEKKTKLAMYIIPICLICVFLAFAFINPLSAYMHRLWSTFDFLETDDITYLQANKRIPVWGTMLSELFSNYHFLYGYGFFRRTADSMYVQILHSAGVLGFLPFLYFLGRIIKRSLEAVRIEKADPISIAALAAFVSFLVFAAFGDQFANKRILIPLFAFLGLHFRNIVAVDEKVTVYYS